MQGCCIFMPGAAVHGVTGCSALHRLIQGRRWKLPHCGGISLVYPHNKPLANAKDFIFYLFCVAFTKNILLHSEMPSKQAWHLQSSTVFSTRFFYKHTSFLLKSTINELACLVLPFSAAPTVNFDFTSHCRAPFLTGLVNPPWNHEIRISFHQMKSLWNQIVCVGFYGCKEENSTFTAAYLCQSQRFIEMYIYLTKSDDILCRFPAPL